MEYKFNIRLLFISLFFILSYTVCGQNKYKVIDKTVRIGMHQAHNRKIDVVIVHSVYNASEGDKYDIDLVLKQFSRYHVSSHYVIGRKGDIYQLVSEKDISYHAGRSSLPDGRTGVNSCSIGIELITTNDSIDSPTEKQIQALTALVKDIKSRYKIKYVLRHSDIAPGRKTDPWNMNWEAFLKRLED